MGLSLEDSIQRIDNLILTLEAQIPRIATEISLGVKANIQDRFQESGKDATGKLLPPYSEPYAKYRDKNKLQTEYVDLTFSRGGIGMWSKTGLTGVTKGKKFLVSIGGQDGETKDKLRWNSERYGDILRPSKSERNEAIEIFSFRLEKIVKDAFR